MNFEAHGNDDDAGPELTTLVDVVFILLSFFVLTAKFGHERDVGVGAEPPARSGAAIATDDLPQRIVVRLTPGESGGVRIAIGRSRLDAFTAITGKLAEINLPDVPVVIAADAHVSVDHVAQAMDAVLAGPMKRLSLSRLEGGPAP